MPRVVRRASAKRDPIVHFAYIGERNLDRAERFLRAADETFTELAKMPEMGSPGKIR